MSFLIKYILPIIDIIFSLIFLFCFTLCCHLFTYHLVGLIMSHHNVSMLNLLSIILSFIKVIIVDKLYGYFIQVKKIYGMNY